jgi:hypothetical protein
MGDQTTASGDGSTAMGVNTTASNYDSTAMGAGTTASGYYSTAMGNSTTASGEASTAMGGSTTADGDNSTAMGLYTTADGDNSTAMGVNTKASGENSLAGGKNMRLTDTADHTFVWGHSTIVESISTANAFLIFPAGTAGKVGIGTKSPSEKLDVVGHIKVEGEGGWDSAGDEAIVGLGSVFGHFFIKAVYGDGLKLGAYGVADAFVLKEGSGNVGIGTTSPGYKLEVNGSAGKPNGGSWSNSSDERLKDITGEYNRGLDEIVTLKPVTFYYKEGNLRGLPTNEENIGFIAQEVQDVFPEAVSEGADGYLDFNMHPVNVAVVNAIKELKAENDNLKAENDMLRKKIEKIEVLLGI